jgi:hypothetical protein
MVKSRKPQPVKFFIGILSGQDKLFSEIEKPLTELYGPIDFRSNILPFDFTDYYKKEMGSGIKRYFLSFEDLIDPGILVSIKRETNRIETKFSEKDLRKINLDPGYLDFHKVVLASGKFGGQKIYLSQGIYADMTLRYIQGKFHPTDTAFPDFKSGQYVNFFMTIRQIYKKQSRNLVMD